MTRGPLPAIAWKLAPSRRFTKLAAGARSGRTLIARCSIHALLSPGLYALIRPSEPLSSSPACARAAAEGDAQAPARTAAPFAYLDCLGYACGQAAHVPRERAKAAEAER